MAYDNAASPARNRFSDEPHLFGLARDLVTAEYRLQEEHRTVELARDLVTAEYRLRDEPRDNRRDRTNPENRWDRLTAALRRFMDRLVNRTRPGPSPDGEHYSSTAGREADRVAPQQPDQTDQSAVPVAQNPPERAPEQLAHPDMAHVESRIRELSQRQHKILEDAVLHLVRTDENVKRAFEESPESMPTVARYATNAYMRELQQENGVAPANAATEALSNARDRWERTAPQEQSVAMPDRRGFGGPDKNDMTDGLAFQEAERARSQWESAASSRTVLPDYAVGAQEFFAAERAAWGEQAEQADRSRQARQSPEGTPAPAPVSPVSSGSLISPVGREVLTNQPSRSPSPASGSSTRSSSPTAQSRADTRTSKSTSTPLGRNRR
ncbi:hypothetical protein ABZ678_26010 [Streptomyces hirsutus]|uniref:hypothetical protein n=1 Tax=Streptomyces hirsutus TaxID=35620 RepID=UPI00340A30D5